MDTVVALGHLATALAIGLLLGVEREHDNADDSTRPAGSRTFPLIALAGAVSAALSPVALGAVAALVIVWYLRAAEPGATTEIAAIATFLLGALACHRPELAVPVGGRRHRHRLGGLRRGEGVRDAGDCWSPDSRAASCPGRRRPR